MHLLALIVVFTVFVSFIWYKTGGSAEITRGWSRAWRVGASITGIWTSLAGMIGLLLSIRLPWMERAVGLDRLLIWHRIAGDTMGLLLGLHIATSVMAEMPMRGGLVNTILDLTGREPYMALTASGAMIIGVVIVSSLKAMRNKLAYETWYFVHLTAYLGLVLSFSHQITLGTILSSVTLVRWLWVVMSVYIVFMVLFGRWSEVVSAVRHPLRIVDIRRETSDSLSILIGGPHISRFSGEAGQFVSLRMLVPGQWWKTNPYSLSNSPSTDGMRITIKDRGDASSAVRKLRVGDRVAVEGPYGIITPSLFDGYKPLFVAGGVGVTPVRAMLESLPTNSQPIVLLRAAKEKDIPHYDEICAMTKARGGQVLTVVGRTAALKGQDPFSGKILQKAIPHLSEYMAFVCGPTSLTFAARKGLIEAGLPSSRVHLEMPWW